jgi:hypothetical protein
MLFSKYTKYNKTKSKWFLHYVFLSLILHNYYFVSYFILHNNNTYF